MNQRLLPGLAATAMTTLLMLSPLGLSFLPVHAQSRDTITVSTCDEASLRTAINNASAGDTITFSCSDTIMLSSTLSISKNLILDGSGQNVILSGGDTRRVLQVADGVQFTLNKLTIANGQTSSGGGGLRNDGGTVIINNSTFSNNVSKTAKGGGIYNSGTMTINNSTFSGNSVTSIGVDGGSGAGIYNLGTTTINNSTFSKNNASILGGGLQNGDFQFGVKMIINNSTFSDNTALRGGGIYNYGDLTVNNSTIADNKVTGSGGGIVNKEAIILNNSTIARNTATSGDGRKLGTGGGFYNLGGPSDNDGGDESAQFLKNGITMSNDTVIIRNSTIVNNTADQGGGLYNVAGSSLSVAASIVANNTTNSASRNCELSGGSITDLGYNLESGTDCGFTASTGQQKADPKLDQNLKDNGGPTQTMALQMDSAAINKIPADATLSNADGKATPVCPATDQRGWSRPDGQQSCDIGAYQSSYTAPSTSTAEATPTASPTSAAEPAPTAPPEE